MKALLVAAVLSIVAATLGAGPSTSELLPRQKEPPVQRKTCTSSDGVTLVYSAAGVGDTALLFVHGGFADRSFYWATFEAERFPYRPDRPGRHYELIVAAMREKVRQNPRVQQTLLATGL